MKALVLLLSSLLLWSPKSLAVTLQLEGGLLWQSRNDVRIPPDTGGDIDLTKSGSGPQAHLRAEVFVPLAERHQLRAVIAPLRVEGRQTLGQDVNYVDGTFAGGQDISTLYRFDSYRASYIYKAYEGQWGQFFVGLTLKAREARIRLQQGLLDESYRNLGFVPLIYLAYEKQLSDLWSLRWDLDAAAAPQGRAFDMALRVRRHLGDYGQLGLGYRTLEGGADNDKVFTFSWFHYGFLDWSYKF